MLTEFNINTPYPSDPFEDIYTHVRGIKEQFEERFALDHFIGSNQDTTLVTADGYHKQITLYALTTFPDMIDNSSIMFCMLISGKPELCCRKSDGVYQLTKNGKILYKYEVGDVGPAGGIICYKDGSGYCLEASTTIFNFSAFSNITTILAGATYTGIGYGMINTNTIISQSGHVNSAAKLCKDFRGGGFTDWFLPSKDESITVDDTGLPFSETGYTLWSSTELNASTAGRYQTRSNTFSSTPKGDTYKSRAVRAFTNMEKYKKIG